MRRLAPLAIPGVVVVMGLLANDWIAGAAMATLFGGLTFLVRRQNSPMVATVFANQWLQVTAGVIYFALSGRTIFEMRTPVYRPMVVIGLACVSVLFVAFSIAAGSGRRRTSTPIAARKLPWTTHQIGYAYLGAVAGSGLLTQLAWSASRLTQAILVFKRVRYVILFLLLTRLLKPNPRWALVAGIIGIEALLGFSGYFADFREPLVVGAMAVLVTLDRRRLSTWVAIGSILLAAVASGLMWTAIKPVIRKNYVVSASGSDRLTKVLALSTIALDRPPTFWKFATDSLVSRVSSVYFPALALTRVPTVVPYENGAILKGAIQNVLTPRLFNPDKPVLASQSDEVRKYAGVWVGGRETNTSYAFGYAGESYVDFGLPWMFVPIAVFGFLLGIAYRYLDRKLVNEELRTSVMIVIAWSTLSTYEASWVMWIGPSITSLAVIGGSAVLVDRILNARRAASRTFHGTVARSFRQRIAPAHNARVA